MNDIEKIDNYIANRLPAQERDAFQKEIEGNPALKEEVEFQFQLAEGIRKARAAELKRMLNNVPVNGNTWGPGKIAAAALTAGLILTALYYFAGDNDQVATTTVTTSESNAKAEEQPQIKTEELPVKKEVTDTEKEDKTSSPAIKANPGKNGDPVVSTPMTKPALDVVDPSEEMINEKDSRNETTMTKSSPLEVSKMEVITTPSDRKYNFHYQFQAGKLMLYGPFDKQLYEVLEIHGESHAVFLYYKNNYYLLDEKQTRITQLTPIRDAQLLNRLREYRGK